MTSYRGVLAILVVLALLLASSQAWSARFFRYMDESGRLVISHTIPNDRVKFGYEIVDHNARLLQTIEPQLSEEEYQAKIAREAAEKECEEAVDRVHSLYRSIPDIDYAEAQALDSIDKLIANNKANLTHVRSQRTELEEQAAQLDIAGRAISNLLLDNIDSAKAQEDNLLEQIDKRNEEKVQVRKSYEFDRSVFGVNSCTDGLSNELRLVKQGVRPETES